MLSTVATRRKFLNYGHTLGHAIESFLLGSKTELLHGEAIAIGIVSIGLKSKKLNNRH